jgi:hypothetical protein
MSRSLSRDYVLGFCRERQKCNKDGCSRGFWGHEWAICASKAPRRSGRSSSEWTARGWESMVTIMVRERSKLLCGGAEHQKSMMCPYLQQFCLACLPKLQRRQVIESLMHNPGLTQITLIISTVCEFRIQCSGYNNHIFQRWSTWFSVWARNG